MSSIFTYLNKPNNKNQKSSCIFRKKTNDLAKKTQNGTKNFLLIAGNASATFVANLVMGHASLFNHFLKAPLSFSSDNPGAADIQRHL